MKKKNTHQLLSTSTTAKHRQQWQRYKYYLSKTTIYMQPTTTFYLT
jgi:hypothetical protein